MVTWKGYPKQWNVTERFHRAKFTDLADTGRKINPTWHIKTRHNVMLRKSIRVATVNSRSRHQLPAQRTPHVQTRCRVRGRRSDPSDLELFWSHSMASSGTCFLNRLWRQQDQAHDILHRDPAAKSRETMKLGKLTPLIPTRYSRFK
jgi:hypothetical protein